MLEQHLAAEKAGNPDGSVAMSTEDVLHDVVGSPTGAVQGPEAAKAFYERPTENVATERVEVTMPGMAMTSA